MKIISLIIVLLSMIPGWYIYEKIKTNNILELAHDQFEDGKFDEAIKTVTPLALRGNSAAVSIIGYSYALGFRNQEGERKAMEWFRKLPSTNTPSCPRTSTAAVIAFQLGKRKESYDPVFSKRWLDLAAKEGFDIEKCKINY